MVISSLLDFFLPRLCPVCGNNLQPHESFACDCCKLLIPKVSQNFTAVITEKKFSGDGIISDFAALYLFQKDKELQKIIHELKYGNRFVTGKYLGREIALCLKDKISAWSADCLVPVPLYHVKKAERGYNQAEYLCRGISEISGLPVKLNLIKRIRFTNTQTQLNLNERKKNVEGAFRAANSSRIAGKKIILVDDVITTGATIGECAKVLKDSGAARIYALSAALAG